MTEQAGPSVAAIQARQSALAGQHGTAADADLEELLSWDLRIFEERNRSMTYLCEQPVLLEQRAFALGRTIYFYVED